MIENIIIGVMTGIISGGYTGLVISKYILFTSLRREALRIIRRIDYIDGQGYSNYESLPEMVLISSDLLSLNHQKAGDGIMGVFKKINTELSMCSGQAKLATALEFFQNNRSDSFGVKPPLY